MNIRFVFGFLALIMLIGCHKNDPTPQEPAGPLEGTWKSLNMEATEYDQQGKVLIAYSPSNISYQKMVISATEFDFVYESPGFPGAPPLISKVSYTRAGNEIIFPSQNESFTIKKLTLTKLDLLFVIARQQSGSIPNRQELLYHFERQ